MRRMKTDRQAKRAITRGGVDESLSFFGQYLVLMVLVFTIARFEVGKPGIFNDIEPRLDLRRQIVLSEVCTVALCVANCPYTVFPEESGTISRLFQQTRIGVLQQ